MSRAMVMMGTNELKVRVTAYRGHLCIETKDPTETEFFYPANIGRFGCVLWGTERHLGLSDEAVAWLRGVPRNQDTIGDVDTFVADDGRGVFCWLGGPCAIKGTVAEASRNHCLDRIKWVTIANEPPEGAVTAINQTAEP